VLTAALCSALLFAAAAPSGRPDPPTSSVAASRVIVGVVPGDAPFADAALDGILDASFAATGTVAEVQTLSVDHDLLDRMEWARASADHDVRAIYWIEPVDEQRHRLYLFDPHTEQTWVRSLPQGSDPTDVLDTLAAMVRSLTEGMPSGAPRGMQRIETTAAPPVAPTQTEPAPPPSRPPARPHARTHVMLAGSYVGSSFSAAAPWQSGGGIDVDVELPTPVYLRVGIAVVQPTTISNPRLDVWRVPLAVEGGYRFRRDRRVRPELGAALAVDPMLWRGSDPAARPGGTARVGLGPTAGLTVQVWGGFGLHVWARADVWLRNLTLLVEDESGRARRLRPHAVAALVRAGIHFVF
jgi:hypothetical protein